MTIEGLAALRTPEGTTALATAAELADLDPLAAASALRARGHEPALAAAALTQARLRRRAVSKFGPAAARMFFTRTGLEQATRAVVADRRAARLAAAGVRTVADLGCGLGADALAAARAGMRVYAVEADPVTAALAEANAQALGLSDRVTVSIADATTVDVSGADAVFCDPARRRVGTGRRVFDPNDYSPPWNFVLGLAARVPRTVVKVAPGIDHELIPPGAEAEWVSVDGEVVEAALWCGPLARTPRRATLLSSRGRARELVGPPDVSAPAGNVRRFLYDPDGAVVRAHLVAAFATTVDGVVADPTIAYVYADAHRSTPFARRFRVHDVLGFSLKRLRALLRERGIGRVEILKRGSAIDPEHLRRELRLSGAGAATLVLTRVAGAPTTLICDPVD
ncbi:MAG TPA: methyltransferase domain-containing protein [Micromonosporaceae bacterium]